MEYRPLTLDGFVGNERLKKFLKNISLVKPIMFEGEQGIGKTTLAYILADMFGAPSENITDLNCVHFSKIEDMRERLTNLNKSSLFGSKKVLILDEIHELSNKTQQVLLKPLDLLSNNIFIIACTTTTKKVIPTLLDRFDRFRVQLLNDTESLELIEKTSLRDGIKIADKFKTLLVKECRGRPRSIIRGVRLAKDAETEEDIKYLIYESESEESGDVLALMKLLVNKSSWDWIRKELNKLLLDNSPQEIRIGLVNLAAGRVMSDFLKTKEEGYLLSNLYSSLGNYFVDDLPDRSCLILSLYDWWLESRGKNEQV